MSRPTANLRLFVGVYPPAEVAEALHDALRTLPDLPEHRMVRPDQLHMTLLFIGDTPTKELDDTIESVQRATGGLHAFVLQPACLISLPNKSRSPARLVAAQTDAPSTLLELQRRLATRLSTTVRHRPGDRFLPHLTLCRFQRPRRMTPLCADVEVPSFPVTDIRLMRSTLLPGGAEHHQVASCALDVS